ncbi:uncharacterized protein [Blastocystis hominis]|uniref:Uncharacterized protein n=1 Tax=Blastocystis hominis TaxID=12968 RepID=D8M142_BLAHO|nr:uncharacterized protein [Blastocystis hominis]CBK21781.2 unnamed protein product [Blastocystis hominis]|eukprot:XP_012895829.1 uncharacterized protein [Blastocystis hominis]
MVDRYGNDFLGWDATNPYDDGMLSNFSLQLPESSCDTVDDYTETNQIQFNAALPSSTDVLENRQLPSQPFSVKYSSMPPPSSSLFAQSSSTTTTTSSISSRFLLLPSIDFRSDHA